MLALFVFSLLRILANAEINNYEYYTNLVKEMIPPSNKTINDYFFEFDLETYELNNNVITNFNNFIEIKLSNYIDTFLCKIKKNNNTIYWKTHVWNCIIKSNEISLSLITTKINFEKPKLIKVNIIEIIETVNVPNIYAIKRACRRNPKHNLCESKTKECCKIYEKRKLEPYESNMVCGILKNKIILDLVKKRLGEIIMNNTKNFYF